MNIISFILNRNIKRKEQDNEIFDWYNYDVHVHASNAILPGKQRPRVHGCLSCANFLRSHCLGVKRQWLFYCQSIGIKETKDVRNRNQKSF